MSHQICVLVGSTCDPEYMTRGASVVGKVLSKSHRSFGESPGVAGGGGDGQREIGVGAVSRCGIRSSNEDEYLVVNDVDPPSLF